MDHTNEQRRAELARADRLLTAEELCEKYDPEDKRLDHPQYHWWDWYQQVAQGVTREGYWTWVATKCEEEP